MLEELNLSGNKINRIEKDSFSLLKNLKSLNLHKNKLEIFCSFPTSEKLETVIISYNKLKK